MDTYEITWRAEFGSEDAARETAEAMIRTTGVLQESMPASRKVQIKLVRVLREDAG